MTTFVRKAEDLDGPLAAMWCWHPRGLWQGRSFPSQSAFTEPSHREPGCPCPINGSSTEARPTTRRHVLYAEGRSTVKVLPTPTSLSTRKTPPIRSTNAWLIANPSPVPRNESAEVVR